MEISGKIIAVLPLQSGTGRNGTEWKKQDYVVETHDQYPKKCVLTYGETELISSASKWMKR